MYRRIVVPVDGSLLAESALPHAEAVARAFGATVHLLRVVDSTPVGPHGGYGLGMDDIGDSDLAEMERTDARAYLDEKCAELSTRNLAATSELRSGSIVRELLGAARDGDLYVMASHGRTGMTRWFMGSIAEEMTRQSRVPVMLVRSERMADSG